MKDFVPRVVSPPIVLAILIGCTVGCGTGYQRVGGKWCYVTIDAGHGRKARELPVDADSFSVLPGGQYAKDKDSVFFIGRKVEDADPSTFLPIPQTTSRLTSYGKDARRVFLRKREVIGADPGSFRVIEGPYSRDDNRFYCGCVPMDVAHPERFEVVYWNGTRETGGEVLLESYGEVVKEIESTVIVGLGWSRDGEFYYFGPRRVTDRDYATIEVISRWNARDKDGVFCGDLQFQAAEAAQSPRAQKTTWTGAERERQGL